MPSSAAMVMAGSPMRNNNIALQRLWDDQRCVMIEMRRDAHVAFGPLYKNETEALRFLAYLEHRFPHINIASINIERLLIYYGEFCNERPTVSP